MTSTGEVGRSGADRAYPRSSMFLLFAIAFGLGVPQLVGVGRFVFLVAAGACLVAAIIAAISGRGTSRRSR